MLVFQLRRISDDSEAGILYADNDTFFARFDLTLEEGTKALIIGACIQLCFGLHRMLITPMRYAKFQNSKRQTTLVILGVAPAVELKAACFIFIFLLVTNELGYITWISPPISIAVAVCSRNASIGAFYTSKIINQDRTVPFVYIRMPYFVICRGYSASLI